MQPSNGSDTAMAQARGLRLQWARLRQWLWWQWQWRVPSLVWPGQQVEVVVSFVDFGFTPKGLFLLEAERQLQLMGCEFDRGSGFGDRDWCWDWSLKGPVKVAFRGHHRSGLPMVPVETLDLRRQQAAANKLGLNIGMAQPAPNGPQAA